MFDFELVCPHCDGENITVRCVTDRAIEHVPPFVVFRADRTVIWPDSRFVQGTVESFSIWCADCREAVKVRTFILDPVCTA